MSRKSSGSDASGSSPAKLQIFPVLSATIIRRLPGSSAMQTGLWNFSRGKTLLSRYGGGGSGEPTTREVVHGTRFVSPNGFSTGAGSAPETSAPDASHAPGPSITQ